MAERSSWQHQEGSVIRHASLSRPGIRRRTGSSLLATSPDVVVFACELAQPQDPGRRQAGPSRSARSALAPSALSLAPGGKARPPTRPIQRLGYSSRLLHSFEQGELSPPSRSALPRTQEPKGPRAAPSASRAPSSLGAAPSCAA